MSSPETPATGATDQEAPVCYRHPEREAHIRCQRCDRRICPDCMRPAAVGFQCPACVHEGSRETRSGRTPYGGRRSSNPALVSQVLIGLNVVVWLAIMATGRGGSRLLYEFALVPASGRPWQVLTTMFTHLAVMHIGFNMLALWTLGPQLDLAIGRWRFLALYLVSGLAASATVLWLAPPASATIGASGAIFGLLGALLVVAVKVRGDVRSLLIWTGINFAITALVPNISWQGHLGGFLAGLLLGAVLIYAPHRRRTAWQLAGVAAVALVVLVATVTRVAALA